MFLVSVTVAAAVPAPEPPHLWQQHRRAGSAALASGDLATASAELTALDSLVGGHAGALYALAQIAARTGDRDGALRRLHEVADMGLHRDLAADSSFAALAGESAFQSLAGRFEANGRPNANARVTARFSDAAMLPEDVVWDAARKRFLVSSIHWRKVVELRADGISSDFIRPDRADAWGFYGLALDAPRGRLWATMVAGPTAAGYDAADSGRTALVAFDLADGRELQRVELPRDGARHELGDLCVGPDGTVYVSDSRAGGVHRLSAGASALETLAAPGTFLSPQQPVLAADGRRLLVPDYARGIAALTLGTRAVTWLPKPRTLASGGIDGLCAAGRGLIAIQNGTSPHRVIALDLDGAQTRITGWRVLEQASPDLGEPNHGVVVGRDFVLIGNSGWERVSAGEVLETPPGTAPPVLLRIERAVAR